MSNVNQSKFCFCLQPFIVYLYFLPINDLKNSKNISEHLNIVGEPKNHHHRRVLGFKAFAKNYKRFVVHEKSFVYLEGFEY